MHPIVLKHRNNACRQCKTPCTFQTDQLAIADESKQCPLDKPMWLAIPKSQTPKTAVEIHRKPVVTDSVATRIQLFFMPDQLCDWNGCNTLRGEYQSELEKLTSPTTGCTSCQLGKQKLLLKQKYADRIREIFNKENS